jgi:hypothetical protein
MTGLLHKLAGAKGALRALVVLLVVSLVSALSADLRHHAAHAGQAHQPQALVQVSAGSDAVSVVDAASALSGHSITKSHHVGHPEGGASGCDHCAGTCCLTLLLADGAVLPSVVPRSGPVTAPLPAVVTGWQRSLHRPPISSC